MNFFSTKIFFWLGTFWIIIHLIIFGPFSFLNYETAIHYPPDLIPLQDQLFNLPKWFQYAEGGVDRYANYTQNLIELSLFTILPDQFVFFFLQLVMILSSIIFTKRILMNIFSLDFISSVFGSFLYGAMLSNTNHLFFSYALLPVVIYFIDRFFFFEFSLYKRFLFFFLFSIFFSLTCHIPYGLPMIVPAILVWFFYINPIKIKKDIIKIFLVFLFFSIIILFRINDILGILYSLPDSIKILTSSSDSANVKTLLSILTFSSIDESIYFFYTLTILSFGLIIISLIYSKVTFYQKKLLLIIILICFINYFSQFFNTQNFILSKISYLINNTRVFGSYSFYLTILTAVSFYNLKNFFNKKKEIYKYKFLIVPTFFILFIYTLEGKFLFFKQWITLGSFSNNFKSKYLHNLSKKKNNKNLFRVEGVTVPDSFILPAYKLETFSSDSSLKTIRSHNYWRLINYPRQKVLFDKNKYRNSFRLYSPVKNEYYAKDYFNLNLLSLANVKYLISRDEILDENLIKIKSTKESWNSLSKFEKIKINFKENFYGKDYFNVYENKLSLPRLFFVENILFFENKNKLLNTLSETRIDKLHKYAFINKNDIENYLELEDKNLSVGNYEIIEYSSDSIVIKTSISSSKDGFFVILNSYSPYWKIKNMDNNLPIYNKIVPAYHTFWGFYIPSGNSTISIKYEPPRFF